MIDDDDEKYNNEIIFIVFKQSVAVELSVATMYHQGY